MRTDPFYETLCCELELQMKLLDCCKNALTSAPAGYLYIRENKNSSTYYQMLDRSQINITDNPELIHELLMKTYNKNQLRSCRANVKTLKQALKGYSSLTPMDCLNPKQKELFRNISASLNSENYYKAPFDADRHIHETVCGDMVSSKGEVIISNALWHYEIPNNYEEVFPCPDEDGNWFYPDFTIHCPDGTVIIWEHLGLLSKLDYCFHNAGKLHTYHENGYVIGRNLILTQDDNRGNCTTMLAYHIIENYILPHFK